MNKYDLQRELRSTELRIELLEDALLKFVSQFTIEQMKIVSPLSSVVRSYEDIQYLKLKKKYIKFLLWFLERIKQ